MNNNTITVDRLSFNYKSFPIFSDISCKINKGEFIGIIGPNGGGKTTFLNLLMGFLFPLKGSISFFGSKINHFIKKISWVPQQFFFDFQFPISVKDVVLTGRLSHLSWFGTYKKEDKEIVKKYLDLTNMSDKINFPFSKLSGGQKQRVLMARALAKEPSLLILDEPTANIDTDAQNTIYSLLKKLKRSVTIVMVTHDLHHTTNLFDRAFSINKNLTTIATNNLCQTCFQKN